jgi:hypothetical protein
VVGRGRISNVHAARLPASRSLDQRRCLLGLTEEPQVRDSHGDKLACDPVAPDLRLSRLLERAAEHQRMLFGAGDPQAVRSWRARLL